MSKVSERRRMPERMQGMRVCTLGHKARDARIAKDIPFVGADQARLPTSTSPRNDETPG